MPETYQQATVARSLAIASGVNALDADIARSQADPAGALGPLFLVGAGPLVWAVVPVASADPDAAPIDGAGLLVDAVLVRRLLDGSGALIGFARESSSAENNGGALTGHEFALEDSRAQRGHLVYLSVLSYNNVGAIAAMRIVVQSGLSLARGAS